MVEALSMPAPQTVAKPGLTVWWDWKGIVYYELLPPGKTIGSDLYCQQLMRLKKAMEKILAGAGE